LTSSVAAGGFQPVRCDPAKNRSSEAFRTLRETGLVIAEFGTGNAIYEQLYAAAHALGVPAIRLLHTEDGNAELPWILRGDPGGYQDDIVRWRKPNDLPDLIIPRIKSMFRLSPSLPDDSAVDYLQSKRYAQFFVFISHTLKPPNRALVEHIYTLLKERDITPFEYHQVNSAGQDWRVALNDSLQKTTHFVALLSPDYEVSQTCTYELETILARGGDVSVLPFMVNGRAVPNPKLSNMHNTLLESADPRASAMEVVRQVTAALDVALGRLEPG